MKTFHLHITGQVQGVGFRPFVYVQAIQSGILGWVKNTIDGVHIRFNARSEEEARHFAEEILGHSPRLSIVTGYWIREVEMESFDHFSIVHSDEAGKADLMVTPDFAICSDCSRELNDPANRRYGYPFITCTNCGPRYSIVTRLPYDRPYTTMQPFTMCPECDREYHDPLDRRYFSQTNSCPDCPVRLSVFRSGGSLSVPEFVGDPIGFIADRLGEGAILAVKGIGGYLLLCSAEQEVTIRRLRERKHRPAKAFAMMFPDLATMAAQLELHPEAEDWLSGPVSSIVLLKRRKNADPLYAYDDIAPGLDRIGVMLPYAPLFKMILDRYGKAVLATSGNISDEPIAYKDEYALQKLASMVDYVVTHDREIGVPQDDSVIGFSETNRIPIVFRRSRGMAPGYLDPRLILPGKSVLAAGADLKSSFSFLYNHRVFISQYLGDLEDYGTQQAYRHTLEHFLGLFRARPEVILYDRHPLYFSTRLAEEYSRSFGVPGISVQHHEAHFAAILGEKNLFEQEDPVLGVIWDGTGYGDDRQIWGGELFRYQNRRMERVGQVGYFDFILGDKMPKEPRIAALAIASKIPEAETLLKEKFSVLEWGIYQKILDQPEGLRTSSMGRLFDAVASLVLNMDTCSYEGEAAMYLEVAGRQFWESTCQTNFEPFELPGPGGRNLDSNQLVRQIVLALRQGLAKEQIAYRFHCTLVDWIERQAVGLGIKNIAFSGGVMQNALLIDLLEQKLNSDFTLHFHEKLSPNDECISFGQLMHYLYLDKR